MSGETTWGLTQLTALWGGADYSRSQENAWFSQWRTHGGVQELNWFYFGKKKKKTLRWRMLLGLFMIPLKNVCEAVGLPNRNVSQISFQSAEREFPETYFLFFKKAAIIHMQNIKINLNIFPLPMLAATTKSTWPEYSLEISLPKPNITYCATSCCYRVSFYVLPVPDSLCG